MKILFITHGDSNKASSRVRAFWIGDELQRQGEHCDSVFPQTRWQVLACLKKAIHYDVFIFQKTYGRYHHWLQKIAALFGKKTYVDIDDAPSLTQNPKTLNRVAAMMRLADGVFVGSSNLKTYASEFNRNTHLIPSTIKLENYRIKSPSPTQEGDRICVGWIGNGNYYAEDLVSILRNPLQALSKRHPICLKIVGACGNSLLREVFSNIDGLEYVGIDAIDWSNPEDVCKEIQSFDIGLYPLIGNSVNYYKCGFKALEYMACGLPVVSSPVANNAEIVAHGESGFIASSEAEWNSAIETLIDSEEKRLRFGQSGRLKVEREYSTSIAAAEIVAILKDDSTSKQ